MFFNELKSRVGEFVDHPPVIKHSLRASVLIGVMLAGEMAKGSEERNFRAAVLLAAASAGSLALGTTAALAGRIEAS